MNSKINILVRNIFRLQAYHFLFPMLLIAGKLLSQNVGIGTNTPSALLHTHGLQTGGGNVLFEGSVKMQNPGPAPISGGGTRMMWYPDKAAFRAGSIVGSQWDAANIGYYSVALGLGTVALGNGSFAVGQGTVSEGDGAVAMGILATARGRGALAIGENTFAIGENSTAIGNRAYTNLASQEAMALGNGSGATGLSALAIGNGAVASGNYAISLGNSSQATGSFAMAIGSFTTGGAFMSTALGSYNRGLGDPTAWVPTDPILEVGSGSSEQLRHNALTILKNGHMGINLSSPTAHLHISAGSIDPGLRLWVTGVTRLLASPNGGLSVGSGNTAPGNGLRVAGETRLVQHVSIGSETTPNNTLHVRHGTIAAGTSPIYGIRIQNTGANNHHWTLYTTNSNGVLSLYSATGGNTAVGNFNAGTGAYSATSNRHLKTNVQLIDADILTRIQQLQPASYSYLRDPLQQRTVGFMAEDVQPIFPELVDTIGENGENLAINYAGFSVVAIKAIQLLQEKLDEKEKRIETLEAEMKEIKKWMMGKQ
jgi:hypothetical protein